MSMARNRFFKKCPECAEDIEPESQQCQHCGARFEVDRKGFRQKAVPAEGVVPPSVTPPELMPGTWTMTAFAGTKALMVAIYSLFAVTGLFLVTSVASYGGAYGTHTISDLQGNTMLWGLSATQYAFAPAALWLGAIVLLLASPRQLKLRIPSFGVRARKRAAQVNYQRKRKEFGASIVMSPKRFVIRWWLTLIVWLGMAAMAGNIYVQMGNRSMDAKEGFYISSALITAGIVNTLVLMPLAQRRRVIRIDVEGNIHQQGGPETL
ncbi:MAG: hypothetical protein ACYCXE_03475 [Thermoleophilia bacterium]